MVSFASAFFATTVRREHSVEHSADYLVVIAGGMSWFYVAVSLDGGTFVGIVSCQMRIGNPLGAREGAHLRCVVGIPTTIRISSWWCHYRGGLAYFPVVVIAEDAGTANTNALRQYGI